MSDSDQAHPLRILLAGYRSHPHVGGQGIYLKHLSRALADLGHSVTVVSGPPYPQLDNAIQLIQLPSMNLYEHPSPLKAMTFHHWHSRANWVEWLGKISGKFTEPQAFGIRLANYLKKHGHNFDIVHDNQCLASDLLRIKLPLTATIHHPITRDFEAALASAKTPLARFGAKRWYSFLAMQEKVARQLPAVVTVSESSRQDIAACFKRPSHLTDVIFNGLDTSLFCPRTKDSGDQPATLLTTSSSDQPVKGFGVLLEAFSLVVASNPNIQLRVIGKLSNDSPHCRTLEKLNIRNRVCFESGLSDQAMSEAYQAATLYICPSLYEGFGLPVAEAMSCGTPVITSDGGALPEVVGHAGVVVPAGDVVALSEAITSLLNAPEKQAELSTLGRARALEQFCWQSVALQYVAHYRKVIAKSQRLHSSTAEHQLRASNGNYQS